MVEYQWDFDGDGVIDLVTTDSMTDHTYELAGTFTVQVTVVDDQSLTSSASITVLAEASPVPPEVVLTFSQFGTRVPLEVTFTAIATDLDGDIAEYQWDFNGDGNVDDTTPTDSVNTIYTSPGTYLASVTVVDDQGLTASATTSVTARSPRPPPPPPTTPTPTPSPTPVAADIQNFTLPDITVAVGTTVTWTNEDGASHTTTSGQNGQHDGIGWNSSELSTSQSFSYTFNEVGTFAYTCRIHPFMSGMVTVT